MSEEPDDYPERQRSYMRDHHAIRFPECKTTFKMNPDFAYVLGVLWGDAGTYINERKTGGYHYRIMLTAKSPSFAQAFKQALQSTINTKVNQCTIKQRLLNGKAYGPYIKLETNSMPFCEWYKTKTLQDIANEITKAGPECIAPFIRGFFDSDGTAYFNPKWHNREIKIYKCNLEKLQRTKEMLATLGIESEIRSHRPGNVATNVVKRSIPEYALRIYTTRSQATFIQKVGSNVESKKKNLVTILDYIKNRSRLKL